jgi:uncharacterized protein
VIVQITIDAQGKVRDAKVLHSLPLLEQAALDAVLQWEYTPMLVNGQPTSVDITVPVTFTLPEATPENTVPRSSQPSVADPAVSALRAAAIRGDTTAQVLLSFRLMEGRGVTKNEADAAEWLRRAAEAGNALGQKGLGSLYLGGDREAGISRNIALGIEWLRRAAEQADSGVSHLNDPLPPEAALIPEYSIGRELLKGCPVIAAEQLGGIYDHDGFVTKDYAEAMLWYRRAADQGAPNAHVQLGAMFQNGLGVARDDIEAEKWFIIAAQLGPDGIKRAARDALAEQLTSADLAEAQRRARDWLDAFKRKN